MEGYETSWVYILMAVPTFAAVMPNAGPSAGGNAVKITGTGFRLYVPPAYGYVGTLVPSRVQVLFGGIVAPKVDVMSAMELWAEPPSYIGNYREDAFSPVALTLTNLDDSGIPIPGEQVVTAAVYTYTREALRAPTLEIASPFARITRALIRLLQQQIMSLSGIMTSTDYSADGIVITKAGVPSIFLNSPSIEMDAYGEDNEEYEENNLDGNVYVWPNQKMQTMRFSLAVFVDDSHVEMLTLMGAVSKFFRKNAYLVLIADVPANATLRMPLILTDPPMASQMTMNANLKSFSATFEVRRIPVLYLPPYLVTSAISSIELQAQKISGTLVEVVNI